MTQNSRALLIAALLMILLIAGAYVFIHRSVVPGEGAASTSTGSIASSTDTSSGGYTITPVDVIDAPDANRPLIFFAQISEADRVAIQKQFADALDVLKKDSNDFNAWVTIASLRKTAGDYQSAVTDWEYIGKLYPTNKVSFASIANVSLYYLKDYAKASIAYQTAIKNDPKQIYLYSDFYQLVTVYPQARTDFSKTLDRGIAANPNDPTLAQLKAELSQ